VKEMLFKAKEQVLKVASMILHDLTDDDKRLCMQLLAPVDAAFPIFSKNKKIKPFEEVYLENTGRKRTAYKVIND